MSRLAMKILTAIVTLSLTSALKIVLPGGTGPLGRVLASTLSQSGHSVTILCRNSFLAATPNRVSGDFGWVGRSFLESIDARNVRLRDWDGGDLLDIVGNDWFGWQEDALKSADIVINLVGGFTAQREMAAERLIRESNQMCPMTLHVSVSPTDEDMAKFKPVMLKAKLDRLGRIEKMYEANCNNVRCLRLPLGKSKIQGCCDEIMDLIKSIEK
eukprot:CAMPEP_0171323472 /NCGR_PEP_ID=MMETSP0816-20121228/115599_1 /TAXON_ID=420281 /ORGANISM="Proboscia inermis, Strain CCAP1064/1" /LENGTH=213 /DNA_ID=CAMNT_0011822191 /DNA_START=53 /DNA_END=694 /DNA_ORIENTATION=+